MSQLPSISPHPFTVFMHSQLWVGIATSVFLLIFGALTALMIRKSLATDRGNANDKFGDRPVKESTSEFVTASMQAVIERLRVQEKELARLHSLAQERAQESERFADDIARYMPAGLLLVNATGSIGSANAAAEDALGVRSIRYRGYREILGASSEFTRMLVECFTTGRTFQRDEIEHLTAAGQTRCLRVTISPIHRSSGPAAMRARLGGESHTTKPSSALCLISDLTELVLLQKQLQRKETLAVLGEISTGIAHEFKNALGAISVHAETIYNQAQPGEIRDSSAKILEHTRPLIDVAAAFVRFAAPVEICRQPVAMQGLIEHAARQLGDSAQQVSVSVSGDFQQVSGDATLIGQALLNLISNAAEAIRGATSPCIEISGSIEDLGGRRWQRIAVADNGAGIGEQDLAKVFLPFYTTKPEGAGLGLAVAQKVALQHGGSIEARNRTEGGAEFLLWLPLRHEAAAPAIDAGRRASKI